MKLSRRGWNNVIIVAVIGFIAMVKLPELIKERLSSASSSSTTSSPSPALQRLLPEQAVITQLVLPHYQLMLQGGQWVAEPSMQSNLPAVVNRWQTIAGTAVDKETMTQLKPQLTAPRTVEIWLMMTEEPVRVTVYQLPQFWLLQGWQGRWLAISVDDTYLFPD
ncbi:hypothetical protein ACFL53_01060 [Pseudomonadota bacterium]